MTRRGRKSNRSIGTRFVLFGLWLAAAGALAWRHIIWRDEARALSIAIQGEDWIAMLRGLHGDGHPAFWYLLLRAVHWIAGRPEVLQLAHYCSLMPLPA